MANEHGIFDVHYDAIKQVRGVVYDLEQLAKGFHIVKQHELSDELIEICNRIQQAAETFTVAFDKMFDSHCQTTNASTKIMFEAAVALISKHKDG